MAAEVSGVAGHDLDDEAELVRADLLLRLEVAHDAVAPVDVEEQRVALRAIDVGHAGAHVVEVHVELADQDRIADAGDGDGAPPRAPDPLELQRIAGRRTQRVPLTRTARAVAWAKTVSRRSRAPPGR